MPTANLEKTTTFDERNNRNATKKTESKMFEVKADYCYLTGRHYNKAEWCRNSTQIQPQIFKTGKK